ncbi:MAG: hypothetical protein HYY26_01240, partial [Acidobacteria bacterium]|nr:hypothetical protein [Acidobacteriota bacterium]
MNQRTLVALTALSVVALFAGCSKEQPAEKAAPAPTAVPAPAIDPATAATVAGKIVFKGGKPRRAPIRMDADAACAALHKQPVMSEEVVINDNGTLRNVFVYVKTGLGDRPFPPPAQPMVLDQHGCLYSPHVIGLQVNQELQVLN